MIKVTCRWFHVDVFVSELVGKSNSRRKCSEGITVHLHWLWNKNQVGIFTV